MAKGKRRRRDESSSESEDDDSDSDFASSEDNSSDSMSEDSDEDSSDDDSDADSSSGSDISDSDSSSASDSSDDDDDDYSQLLEVLSRAGLKSAGKKLVANKVFTVTKARDIPTSKLVKKFGIKESEARTMKKLLNDPTALVPPESSESDSSGGSESEDEDELVWRVLRAVDLSSLIKVFKKSKVHSLKQAYKLTDKKLKRMGIDNKDTREKILHEFEKKKDNKTSSEEDEEVKLAKILKSIDMKRYIKNLQRGKITNLDAAYALNSSTLKSLGVLSKRDRRKIMAEIAKYKKSHAEDDPALALLKRALVKVGLRKYFIKFKSKGIDSIKKLKRIEHRELREIGVQMYRERREIMERIERINDRGEVEKEEQELSGSGSDSDNVINEVLRSQYMSRHIPDFKRTGIKDLKAARKLTQTQLRSMGVALYLDREKLINAFKDYRPKNQAIMRVLIDNNLSKHAGEFEKLVDIQEARSLTHADLRAMGINLYGQRDRLIKAFARYDDDDDDTRSRSSRKVRRKRLS